MLHLETNLAKLLEVQVLFFFYYLKHVSLGGERAIQWKDNWVKWRVTIKMIELLAFITGAFYERKWIDKFCSCNSNHRGWKAVHSQNNCRGKAFNLYNWHFNMDTIFKSLEGISRVLLATNFKNLLKETGNFVMFNNFKK